jgi:hypothetical protein
MAVVSTIKALETSVKSGISMTAATFRNGFHCDSTAAHPPTTFARSRFRDPNDTCTTLPCYHGFEQQDLLHTNGCRYRQRLLGKSLGCGSMKRMEGLLDALDRRIGCEQSSATVPHACSLAQALSLRRTINKAV